MCQFNTDAPTAAASGLQFVPQINWVQDYDDSNPLAVVDLEAKQGLKVVPLTGGRNHNITVRPKPASSIFQSTLVTGYSVPKGLTYVNSTYPSVPHFAIKGYLSNMYLGASTIAASCCTFNIRMTIGLKDFQ